MLFELFYNFITYLRSRIRFKVFRWILKLHGVPSSFCSSIYFNISPSVSKNRYAKAYFTDCFFLLISWSQLWLFLYIILISNACINGFTYNVLTYTKAGTWLLPYMYILLALNIKHACDVVWMYICA